MSVLDDLKSDGKAFPDFNNQGAFLATLHIAILELAERLDRVEELLLSSPLVEQARNDAYIGISQFIQELSKDVEIL